MPELKNNLISIPKNSYKIIFEGNRANVKRSDGTTVMTAHKRNGLYIMNINEDRALQSDTTHNNLVRWHKRFRPPQFHGFKEIAHERHGDRFKLRLKKCKCKMYNLQKEKFINFHTKALNIDKKKNSVLYTRTFVG